MAVWKRYNGKRIKGEGPKGKGIWIVEFRLRGHYIKEAIPEARTKQREKTLRNPRRQTRSHPPHRRRGFADGNATRRNPGHDVGERRFRTEDDLRCSHEDRSTSKASHEQSPSKWSLDR